MLLMVFPLTEDSRERIDMKYRRSAYGRREEWRRLCHMMIHPNRNMNGCGNEET
jgi:hypothetical protein